MSRFPLREEMFIKPGVLSEVWVKFFSEVSRTTVSIGGASTETTIDDTAFQWNGNTNSGGFTYTLPAGIQGKQYKIVNVGTSGNVLTVAPNGSDNLLGENSSFELEDGESLLIAYDITYGWY